MAQRYANDQHVMLVADEDKGWDEELAVVVAYDATSARYLVRVADRLTLDEAGEDEADVHDDGIREVSEEDVRPL
jgi:hypothetical protein